MENIKKIGRFRVLIFAYEMSRMIRAPALEIMEFHRQQEMINTAVGYLIR
jgi:hypothetical protein